VRELKNVVERAVVICRSTVLGVPELVFLQPGKEEEPRGLTLQEVELDYLRRTIAASDGNISLAAKTLAIDRSTLIRKIKRYGLNKPSASA
jgi:DNA-binding NtrC family response regulator